MTIDENHPAVRRLVEKLAAEKTRAALQTILDGIGKDPPMGSLVIPMEEDVIERARFDGWLEGIKQGHQNLLRELRWKIANADAAQREIWGLR